MINREGGESMTLVKRIYLSLIRNKWRTLLLIILVSVLGSVFVSALFIQKAYQLTGKMVSDQLPLTAKVIADQTGWNKYHQETGEWLQGLTKEEQDRIGKLPQVARYDIFRVENIESKFIKKVRSVEEVVDEEVSEDEVPDDFLNQFRLKSTIQEMPIEEEIGMIKLAKGRGWTKQEQESESSKGVLVSEGVAKENGWQVGTTFNLDVMVDHSDEDGEFGINIPLKVQWIYQLLRDYPEITSERSFEESVAISTLENTIYTTDKMALMINEEIRDAFIQLGVLAETAEEKKNAQLYGYDTTYYLKDKESLNDFREDASALIDMELYQIKLGTDQFDALNPSLAKLNQLGNWVKWLGGLAMTLVLSLVIFLSFRGRQQEFGIFLTLGLSRGRLLLQVGLEFLVVALIGSVGAMFFGQWLAQKIAVTLREEPDGFRVLGGTERQEQLEFVQMGGIESAVDGSKLFTLSDQLSDQIGMLGAVLLITSIGVLLAMFYLLRLRPSFLLRQG